MILVDIYIDFYWASGPYSKLAFTIPMVGSRYALSRIYACTILLSERRKFISSEYREKVWRVVAQDPEAAGDDVEAVEGGRGRVNQTS